MKLRFLKKYYRASDGFDGGSTFQTYNKILQYSEDGGETWLDIEEFDDIESKKTQCTKILVPLTFIRNETTN